MNSLETWCTTQKQTVSLKTQDYSQPVRVWTEPDVQNKRLVDALVIILRTKGCSWAQTSGCTMCGYFNDSSWEDIPEHMLKQQWDTALSQYTHQQVIKIFTSGSFLDTTEVPEKVRNHMVSTIPSSVQVLQVESRPDFVTPSTLSTVKKHVQTEQFRIGMGLETSNDIVRKYAVNKGFTFTQFTNAAEHCHTHDVAVKTYVLLKPPFLTEQEAIDDCITTIQEADKYTDVFSLNPVNVQRHTIVEYLWKRNQYRPPWLWSVVRVLQQGKKHTKKRIQCDVVGGGSWRGPHNCNECDKTVLHQIAQYSLEQDESIFNDKQSCRCHTLWEDQLDLESLTFGSYVDWKRDVE